MNLFVAFAMAVVGLNSALAAPLNTAKIESLTQLKGKLDQAEGVFKVSFPRSDLKPSANGVLINPALGLTAWAAFTKTEHGTMVRAALAAQKL
jgi:hypothetical protein